jgi:hypothetical protein
MTCLDTNKKGEPCRAPAMNGAKYCYSHDPEKASERRSAQAKGGRNRSHAAIPGPMDLHFDLRDPNMRSELINFAANQVLRGRLDPKVGYLMGFFANIARADQAAALKQPEDVRTCGADEIPLLQLPENAVRKILSGYSKEGLEELYSKIVERQEYEACDAAENEDLPACEVVPESSAVVERTHRTSIGSLKAVVVYFMDSYFWNHGAAEVRYFHPGYADHYRGDPTEFLHLHEVTVLDHLCTLTASALEELLEKIDQLKERKSKELPDELVSEARVPLGLRHEVSIELLESMAQFLLSKRRDPFNERFAQPEPLDQQARQRSATNSGTDGEAGKPIEQSDVADFNPPFRPPEPRSPRQEPSESERRSGDHPDVTTIMLTGGSYQVSRENPSLDSEGDSELALDVAPRSERDFRRALNQIRRENGGLFTHAGRKNNSAA